MDKPNIAATHSQREDVKAGRIYWWCACGLSQKQPFCDGSHKGTGFAPIKVQSDKDENLCFCLCKHSKNAPFCDGTHRDLR